ncbi:MAG: hypothetical protein AB1486_13200 [Planctomycetota bacterium]
MSTQESFVRALVLAALLSGVACPALAQAPSQGQATRPRPGLVHCWEALGPLPGAGPSVGCFSGTPADPDRIYATSGTGVIVSDDAGLSWQPRPTPSVPPYWQSIGVSPADRDVALFGSWWEGIYRTEDGGLTWTRPSGVPGEDLFSPTFAPTDPSRVYVGAGDGVWRSLDGGLHFEQVLSGILSQGGLGWSLAVDSLNALHAYYTAWYLGLYETTDGGTTWQFKSLPSGMLWPLAFAVDPADGQRLLIAYRDVFLSTDGGTTWSMVYDQDSHVDALSFDPLDQQRFYAALRTQGLSISSDGGLSWTPCTDPGLDRAGGLVGAILPSASRPGLLLIGDVGGVFRSLDRGQTFTRSNGGLESHATISDIAVDPFNPLHLVALTGASAFASDDGGTTWTESMGMVDFTGYSLEADRGLPGRYYMPAWDGTFWRSDDGGATFYPAYSLGMTFWKMAAHPTAGGRLFAATEGGLYRSDDGGEHFTPAGLPMQWTWTVAISPVEPDLVYCVVGTTSIMYCSEDGGATWVQAEASPGSIVREIIPDPIVADRAYTAGSASGFYRTEDRGRTWTSVSVELAAADTAVIPGFNPRLLIANDWFEGARVSLDHGESATLLNRGLTSKILSFDASPTGLYAATSGSGVMLLR